MTNAIAIYERVREIQTAAAALHQSGFFKDVTSQAQAMVKVMAGAELGLPPFAAMTGIHIVQGKPVIGANLIATMVKNSGRYDYHIKHLDNQVCILSWYEGGQRVGEAGFTIEEANAAGLTNKPTWKAYTSDMLFARAISRGARRFAPGIFGGAPVYTPDEMGVETDEDGEIIPGVVVTVTTPNAEQPATVDPVAAFVKQAEQRQSVQVANFANGRLTAWVNYVTGNQFNPAHAEYLNQVLDRYCSAVADNGNTHTKDAAEKARADYAAGLAALTGQQDDLFGAEHDARQAELKAAALETARQG